MKHKISCRVNIEINAKIATIWRALTDPELIQQYFFGTNTITDWKVGSPIRFKGNYQGKDYEDKGTILENETNKRLSYTYWSSMSGIEDLPENYMIVSFDISGQDGEAILSLTQQNIPDEKTKAHSEENWKKVLASLKNLVEKENAGTG
jgi:uncharacterized protein YndB with AHSA1/START domain